MSPENKEVFDYLVTFASASGLGGVLLALIGVWKAKAERPHIAASPTPLPQTSVGGLMLSEAIVSTFTMAIQDLADAQKEDAELRRVQMAHEREQSSLMRDHEREMLGGQHRDMTRLTDEINTLNQRMKNVVCSK